MNGMDLVVIAVILAIIGGAIYYIVKEKRRGVQCIGCPAAGECAKRRNGGCSCQGDNSANQSDSHTDMK